MIKWKSKFEFGFFVFYSLRLLHFDFFYVISASRFALLCKLEQSIFITYTIYIYIYVYYMYVYVYVCTKFSCAAFRTTMLLRRSTICEWARVNERLREHSRSPNNYWILSRLSLWVQLSAERCVMHVLVCSCHVPLYVCACVCLSAWRNEPT